ncbi:MAG TPA: ankyrin repeat domain-containing protein [Planctomycetota bacterium]|nr:ankyrin repeat domain-containing protein [Planctomycetota bacterium]
MIQQIADGRTDLVFDYVAQGHPATSKDSQGTPLIVWCAYHGDVSAVRYLLAQGESLDSLGVNRGLNGAVFHGHWKLVQFLLEKGAEVNDADPETGETPLHAALCKANRPVFDHVVRVLLAAGADPRRMTNPSVPTEAFMRDCRTKGETPLHRAAAYGSEASIQMLLDAGASREDKDMNGETPLSWASWHLRPAAVLRKLCYGPHSIHPDNRSSYDHGTGWAQGELQASGS